jgi:8-oxo-dGTP pyrophosphatase MutT (NUDIX family)
MRERFKFDASVFAVVRKDNKVLALRRSGTGWLDGHWSLPAGAHDGGQSFLEGALRELEEETGLVGHKESCRLTHAQHVMTPKSEWLALYFEVDGTEGVAQVQEPHKHDRVELCDLISIEEPVVPYVQEALKLMEKGVAFSVFHLNE